MNDIRRYRNRKWLENQYIRLEKPTTVICKECNVDRKTISNWLKRFRIPIRSSGIPKGKGYIPWNKGYKGLNKGSENPMWKGDRVGYMALHDWIKRYKKKIDKCEICGKETNKLDCANISGDYKRDINDFQWLCRKCHNKKDNLNENLKKGKRFKKGNIPWNKNLTKETDLRVESISKSLKQFFKKKK